MASGISKTQKSHIRAYFDELIASGRTPGAGIAVAVRGEPVMTYVCGTARPDCLATEETLWPIASISKLYTASAVMRLIELGKLTLGAKVITYLPKFHGGGRETITVRQLLTHTSGIRYEPDNMEALISRGASLDEIVSNAFRGKLIFAPGTDQLYSDLGYALLGRIAEVVAGQDFPELVTRLVSEPAGLRSTWFRPPLNRTELIADVEGSFGYETSNGMYNSDYARNLAHPAFGVITTVDELLQFGLQFDPAHATSIHSRMGVLIMSTDQTNGDLPGDDVIVPTGKIHAWGAGFMIKGNSGSPELVSPQSFGHGGASGCYLWIDPLHRLTVAIVSRTHSNAKPEDFFPRIDQSLNFVMSTLTS